MDALLLLSRLHSLRTFIPASSWPRGPESYSKPGRLAVDLFHLETAARRLLFGRARSGCGSLPLLQQLDLLFHIVVPVFNAILLSSNTTVFPFSFGQVPTLTLFWVFRVELLVASIQDVHFWVEKLGILLHIQVPVDLTELRPELWCPFLTELTVEDKNRPFSHELSYVVEVLEKLFL